MTRNEETPSGVITQGFSFRLLDRQAFDVAAKVEIHIAITLRTADLLIIWENQSTEIFIDGENSFR